MNVIEISAEQTHGLRRRVLRDGTASSDVVFDGDGAATTFHLGVVADGTLVGISTWLDRRCPSRPSAHAVQLRGMATDPELRGTGIGAALLVAGIERCRTKGSKLVWARARTSAVGFYERHGFSTIGDTYLDSTTGLPHVDIVLELG